MHHSYVPGDLLKQAFRQSHRDSAEPRVDVVPDWREAVVERARRRGDRRRELIRDMTRGGIRVANHDEHGQRIRKLPNPRGGRGWATATPTNWWKFLVDYVGL